MTVSKNTRMLQILLHRLKVTFKDGRNFTGQLLAFDRHMNLVIGDCEEFRKFKSKKTKEEVEEKRVLGLVILRGEHVISLQVVAPPPAGEGPRRAPGSQHSLMPFPPGMARPAIRGMPPSLNGGIGGAGSVVSAGPAMGMHGSMGSSAPVGLAGPVAGVGHFPPGMMPPPPGMMRPPPPGMRPSFPFPPHQQHGGMMRPPPPGFPGMPPRPPPSSQS